MGSVTPAFREAVAAAMAATVARAGSVSPERVTHPKSIVNAKTSVPEPTPLSALIVSHPGGTTGQGREVDLAVHRTRLMLTMRRPRHRN
jgi:hypothetical protein